MSFAGLLSVIIALSGQINVFWILFIQCCFLHDISIQYFVIIGVKILFKFGYKIASASYRWLRRVKISTTNILISLNCLSRNVVNTRVYIPFYRAGRIQDTSRQVSPVVGRFPRQVSYVARGVALPETDSQLWWRRGALHRGIPPTAPRFGVQPERSRTTLL